MSRHTYVNLEGTINDIHQTTQNGFHELHGCFAAPKHRITVVYLIRKDTNAGYCKDTTFIAHSNPLSRDMQKIHGTIKLIVKEHSLPSKLKHLCKCFKENLSATELNEPGINGEAQPLIQPTSTVISYRADIKKAAE